MKNLEILVVDDLEENRETAKEYFESIGLTVDLAIDYESGKEKLEQKDYYAAILDLQLPNKEGEFGEYGFELEKIAKHYLIPTAVLTGKPMGKGHHGKGSSILMDGGAISATQVKTELEAWEKTYETIKEICNPESIQKAKEQYTKLLGIRFQGSFSGQSRKKDRVLKKINLAYQRKKSENKR